VNGWTILACVLAAAAIILATIGGARGVPPLCWVAVACSLLSCGLALLGARA